MTYDVRFYGHADRLDDGSGRAVWAGGQEVLAIGYDVMIPGYGTKTTNNLRLWESKSKRGFDLNSFNGTSPFVCFFASPLIISLQQLETMKKPLSPPTVPPLSHLFFTQMIIRSCQHSI